MKLEGFVPTAEDLHIDAVHHLPFTGEPLVDVVARPILAGLVPTDEAPADREVPTSWSIFSRSSSLLLITPANRVAASDARVRAKTEGYVASCSATRAISARDREPISRGTELLPRAHLLSHPAQRQQQRLHQH